MKEKHIINNIVLLNQYSITLHVSIKGEYKRVFLLVFMLFEQLWHLFKQHMTAKTNKYEKKNIFFITNMFNLNAVINITKKNWLSKCLKAGRWHLNLRIYICDPSSSCYILLVTVCPCVCSRECMCVKVTSRGANGRSTVIVSHLRDLPSDILAVSHFSHAHSGWTTASFI